MHQNTDLIDLLRALNAAGAKYVIVGAYAFAYHGRPRATKDADIFVGSDAKNAETPRSTSWADHRIKSTSSRK